MGKASLGVVDSGPGPRGPTAYGRGVGTTDSTDTIDNVYTRLCGSTQGSLHAAPPCTSTLDPTTPPWEPSRPNRSHIQQVQMIYEFAAMCDAKTRCDRVIEPKIC